MNEKKNYNNLLDFELLRKLIVGIGEVADITGVPLRQIRYWETKGIILSQKDENGSTRKFDYINIKKIVLIKELLDEGYTLDASALKVEKRIEGLNEMFEQLVKNNKKA